MHAGYAMHTCRLLAHSKTLRASHLTNKVAVEKGHSGFWGGAKQTTCLTSFVKMLAKYPGAGELGLLITQWSTSTAMLTQGRCRFCCGTMLCTPFPYIGVSTMQWC